ncbi:cell division protein FtsL [Ammoniphilus resinae]|uniref:Cell division protein FtsL n=1 Tax=Ammoniphilus resinae TaxID=861532 RepID=A0ABS4GKL8_9BACL|nr:cell division protein FtsL [Ammoniphilus resinae]MBP1930652.1 cell division protein FtsL [Ammoniphilus resinae]
MRGNQYGNLAVQLKQEHASGAKRKSKVEKVTVKYGIPVEEKLLYLLSVIMVVCISGFILSRYALISQFNYDIENTKEVINTTHEENSSLRLKIDELSKRERILDIAQRELGMTMKNSTVRVLSH